jgi:polyhydroxyalkanoate synthesis regulator protein/polyhydroxyalkanoate synthesis regulator phasin
MPKPLDNRDILVYHGNTNRLLTPAERSSTVKIDRKYKIWEATCRDDPSRPVLQHVLIERVDETHGLAIAADGFIMAVVPVELYPDDVVGLVPGHVLKDASTKAVRTLGMQVIMREHEFEYVTRDGNIKVPRQDVGEFPNYKMIIPDRPTQLRKTLCAFSLDLDNFARACKAIGCDAKEAPHHFTAPGGRSSAFLLETTYSDGKPQAPYAVIMPRHIKNMPPEIDADSADTITELREDLKELQTRNAKLEKQIAEDGRIGEVSKLREQLAALQAERSQLQEAVRNALERKEHYGNSCSRLQDMLHDAQAEIARLKASTPVQAPAPASKGRVPKILDNGDTITLIFPKSPKDDVKAGIKALGFKWIAEKTWAVHVNGNKADVMAQLSGII